ncbi:flagellar assembly protein FliW [Pengzhenrongella sp.]|jgi:flagellar assembly factor FliW|uniref:flagellar assembly protein FliW n=1 Tax=Pengzhenrongella sp. TaxID=2888820 RepID=UPI002F92CD6F
MLVHPVAALPGLPDHLEYSLDTLDDDGTLFALRSASDPGVRLFVVRPGVFFADYTPKVDAETRRAIGLGEGDEPLLLVVVHPGDSTTPTTANLLAPVVVNLTTGAATQVVLDDSQWPLRAPLG